jgi:hypothetical protein
LALIGPIVRASAERRRDASMKFTNTITINRESTAVFNYLVRRV